MTDKMENKAGEGSKLKRRYCEHCGGRIPADSSPCAERPDLHANPPAWRVSWRENGETASSILPEVCLKRALS